MREAVGTVLGVIEGYYGLVDDVERSSITAMSSVGVRRLVMKGCVVVLMVVIIVMMGVVIVMMTIVGRHLVAFPRFGFVRVGLTESMLATAVVVVVLQPRMQGDVETRSDLDPEDPQHRRPNRERRPPESSHESEAVAKAGRGHDAAQSTAKLKLVQ